MTTILGIDVFIWTDHPHPRQRARMSAALRECYLRLLSYTVVRGFLVCGNPTGEHLAGLGIARNKIFNFPYWVEVPNEWSFPNGSQATSDKPLRLIGVGRHVSVKGFDIAIEAVALANHGKIQPMATLELVGDGPERRNLETLAKSLGVSDAISFTNWLSNESVYSRMRAADALVVPSRFEGYSVVVLEALANGRPVLASNRVVAALDRDDGSKAIQFHSVSRSDQLSEQIVALANSREDLKKYSRSARRIAELWKPNRASELIAKLIRT